MMIGWTKLITITCGTRVMPRRFRQVMVIVSVIARPIAGRRVDVGANNGVVTAAISHPPDRLRPGGRSG
jgi:hypothetical protein